MTGHATDQDEAEEVLRVLAGYIPDVGDTFTHTVTFRNAPGYSETNHYRVDGWLRRRPARQPNPDPRVEEMLQRLSEKFPRRTAGPDDVPLEFCRRDQAEYVCGAGIAGVIVRVRDVVVDGHVDFPGESREDARRHAEVLAGEPLI